MSVIKVRLSGLSSTTRIRYGMWSGAGDSASAPFVLPLFPILAYCARFRTGGIFAVHRCAAPQQVEQPVGVKGRVPWAELVQVLPHREEALIERIFPARDRRLPVQRAVGARSVVHLHDFMAGHAAKGEQVFEGAEVAQVRDFRANF